VATRSVETTGAAETESLGAELAATLRDGDVVLVRGELGAGKTTLVRGAARALGVDDPVTSPTFSIGHRYRGRPRPPRAGTTVSHLDLYRLADLDAEDPDLLADYVDAETIAFVEWPPDDDGRGDAARELSAARVRVTLSHSGGDRRQVEVEVRSDDAEVDVGSGLAASRGRTGAQL
jgi:tRNA threonylcarbamoyladenosine biosynthesis protein TsaE